MVRIDMNLAMEFLGLIDGGQLGIIRRSQKDRILTASKTLWMLTSFEETSTTTVVVEAQYASSFCVFFFNF